MLEVTWVGPRRDLLVDLHAPELVDDKVETIREFRMIEWSGCQGKVKHNYVPVHCEFRQYIREKRGAAVQPGDDDDGFLANVANSVFLVLKWPS